MRRLAVLLLIIMIVGCVSYAEKRGECFIYLGELARSGSYDFHDCEGNMVAVGTNPISKALSGTILGGIALGAAGAAAGGGLGFLDEIVESFREGKALEGVTDVE